MTYQQMVWKMIPWMTPDDWFVTTFVLLWLLLIGWAVQDEL